ncbi:MAG: hypothetical protein ACLGHP_07400 [Vicinamibacteria bacterium]
MKIKLPKLPPPNRIATYLTALSGLGAAVAIPLGNLDTSSTAGVIAGLVGVLTAYQQWMKGWQAYTERNPAEG